MATTRLIPLHIGKGATILSALSGSLEYIEKPEKTDGGSLVTSYECESYSADTDFAISVAAPQCGAIWGYGDHPIKLRQGPVGGGLVALLAESSSSGSGQVKSGR